MDGNDMKWKGSLFIFYGTYSTVAKLEMNSFQIVLLSLAKEEEKYKSTSETSHSRYQMPL